MSVSVGQRVQSMIDHMSKGEIELALSDICIAIDITVFDKGIIINHNKNRANLH